MTESGDNPLHNNKDDQHPYLSCIMSVHFVFDKVGMIFLILISSCFALQILYGIYGYKIWLGREGDILRRNDTSCKG